MEIQGKLDTYRKNVEGGHKSLLEKEDSLKQKLAGIETENEKLNISLNEVNVSLKDLQTKEDTYTKYVGLIVTLKNEITEIKNSEKSYLQQILGIKQEIEEKKKHASSLNRKHDEKKSIHVALLAAGEGNLRDAQSGFDMSNMDYADMVRTIKDFRMKEMDLQHSIESYQEKIDDISTEVKAINLLAKSPEMESNEKRKIGLKELQENYGKRLNDCILKNTNLRTNIAQLKDEEILLQRRNEEIMKNSNQDQDSKLNSDIDSMFFESNLINGVDIDNFDSQIMPLSIGSFKRKTNNFI